MFIDQSKVLYKSGWQWWSEAGELAALAGGHWSTMVSTRPVPPHLPLHHVTPQHCNNTITIIQTVIRTLIYQSQVLTHIITRLSDICQDINNNISVLVSCELCVNFAK